MRYRPRAGHLPAKAGDVEGWRYRPPVRRGIRLTVPAISAHWGAILTESANSRSSVS